MSKKEPWVAPYEASMALCRYVDGGGCTPDGIERTWHNVFGAVAKCMGFPKKARRFLWESLVQGNWERLHLTEEERSKTPDEWLDELRGDVWYCSDRWSLDRLARCHWTHLAYMDACGERWKA